MTPERREELRKHCNRVKDHGFHYVSLPYADALDLLDEIAELQRDLLKEQYKNWSPRRILRSWLSERASGEKEGLA